MRDLRFGARLTSGLVACSALLFCSFLLARRRPEDPVALLFAFAFAGVAGGLATLIAILGARHLEPRRPVVVSGAPAVI